MKIAIIGTGNLGGAIANGLITNNAITSLYLTKRNVSGLSEFEGYKNVHVVNDGPITPWVNNSFAVLHNGCTTSIEASISGKPVITFIPFDQFFRHALSN